MESKDICIIRTECYEYPTHESCFRPDTRYPEYQYNEVSPNINKIYDAVRQSFYFLNYDSDNYGTPKWNPLGEIIKPGMNVLIKPNLVLDKNTNPKGGTDCLYTHPSVVAPVIDYVLIALRGNGKVAIGDAPVQECDYDKLIQQSGYQKLVDFYVNKGVNIELVDFRGLKSTIRNGTYISKINNEAIGRVVCLGEDSEFSLLDKEIIERMRITNYAPSQLKEHHGVSKHEYYISDYVLTADVIINMPKPKSHRIAGVTISLKNMIGANIRKECLPHHTLGDPSNGGDESNKGGRLWELRAKLLDNKNENEAMGRYCRARISILGVRVCSLLLRKSSKYREGCWYGNQTISKTITDVNKIVFFADREGVLQENKVRKMFIVADMIVSGEKEGPMSPSPKKTGLIVTGTNPIFFDEVVCRLMGFDEKKVPTLINVKKLHGKYSYNSLDCPSGVKSNSLEYDGKNPKNFSNSSLFWFEPTAGWKGHIEITE